MSADPEQVIAAVETDAAIAGAEIVAEQTEDAVEEVVSDAAQAVTMAETSVALAEQTAAAAELQAAETFTLAMGKLETWHQESGLAIASLQAQISSVEQAQAEMAAALLAVTEATQSILSNLKTPSQEKMQSPDEIKTEAHASDVAASPEPRRPRRHLL